MSILFADNYVSSRRPAGRRVLRDGLHISDFPVMYCRTHGVDRVGWWALWVSVYVLHDCVARPFVSSSSL